MQKNHFHLDADWMLIKQFNLNPRVVQITTLPIKLTQGDLKQWCIIFKNLFLHAIMCYQLFVAFYATKNMTTLDEYCKVARSTWTTNARSALAPNNIVEVLALCEAIAEGEMGRDDVEQNQYIKTQRGL